MAVKKVISKLIKITDKTEAESSLESNQSASGKEARPKKGCFFCQNKSMPSYTDLVSLRRFLTDRAKILSRQRSGICSKHQRVLAKNIKYARHLALLPFVPKI